MALCGRPFREQQPSVNGSSFQLTARKPRLRFNNFTRERRQQPDQSTPVTLRVFPDPPLQQLLSKAKPVTVLSLCHPREAATHGLPLTAQHCPARGDGSPPRLCQRNLVGSSSVHRQHGNLFRPPSLSLWRTEQKQRGWFCSVRTQRSQQEKCPSSVR